MVGDINIVVPIGKFIGVPLRSVTISCQNSTAYTAVVAIAALIHRVPMKRVIRHQALFEWGSTPHPKQGSGEYGDK